MSRSVAAVSPGTPRDLRRIVVLVRVYGVVVLVTIGALAVLSKVAPGEATAHAWGHAVVVALFAALLPLRLRAAVRGSLKGLRAVGLIAAVLLLANVVEALVPGFVPGWMKLEMVAIAGLMAMVVVLVARARTSGGRGAPSP